MHVCHLREKTNIDSARGYWGFIVNTTKTQALFSIQGIVPMIIASDGKHIEMNSRWTFNVLKEDEKLHGYETYRVRLLDKSASVEDSAKQGLVVTGKMGHATKHMTVNADMTILKGEPISIIIEFEYQGVKYEDSFRIYFSTDKEDIAVALDFGSEASQARTTDNDANLALVSDFESMLNLKDSSAEGEYWQGKSRSALFKSVFWVHKSPSKTCYGDLPKKLEDRPFVAPLVKANESPDTYKKLQLLPNLKLVELAQSGDYIEYDLQNIAFEQGSNVLYRLPRLSDHMMRESILRIILSNFLHAILSQIDLGACDRYIRLVVMAPNVYYQNKVFNMMEGLYLDFDIIKSNGLYPRCKGLEVQVVSESDAAFVGIFGGGKIKNNSNGYFLNIDSGKGTTDFSILQQQTNLIKFNSLYRDGIPAAGNVITYAYYEALHDFMLVHGIDILPCLRKADKSNLLTFMSYLEGLKIQDVPGKQMEPFIVPSSRNVHDISTLNTYLSNNRDRAIPEIRSYVDEKVQTLVGCLRDSIRHYMDVSPCVFSQVVLSGRALLYHPYKVALTSMLLEEQWIESENDVVWIEGDDAKTCCLKGALSIEGNCDVNYNSGLIGSPLLQKTEEKEGRVKKFFSNMLGKTRRTTAITREFFYEGSKSLVAQNVTLRLGGRSYQMSGDEVEEKKIFFLGSAFAAQVGDSPLQMIDSKELHFNNASYKELVNQSLFPYYDGSIGAPLNRYFKEELVEGMKTKAVVRQETSSTSVKNVTTHIDETDF